MQIRVRRSRRRGHWLRVTSPLYLAVWRALVVLVTVVGVMLAYFGFDRSVLVASMLYTGLIGLAIPDFVRRRAGAAQEPQGSEVPLGRALRRRVGSAGLSAVGVVVLLGLLSTFGVSAVVLPALLAAGSPRALAWYRRGVGPLPAPMAAGRRSRRAAPHTGGRVPAEMTLDELCRAWQASYPELRRCGDPRKRAEFVEARQQFLDELERRDPAAFARWLRSGARAGSDPSEFLSA